MAAPGERLQLEELARCGKRMIVRARLVEIDGYGAASQTWQRWGLSRVDRAGDYAAFEDFSLLFRALLDEPDSVASAIDEAPNDWAQLLAQAHGQGRALPSPLARWVLESGLVLDELVPTRDADGFRFFTLVAPDINDIDAGFEVRECRLDLADGTLEAKLLARFAVGEYTEAR